MPDAVPTAFGEISICRVISNPRLTSEAARVITIPAAVETISAGTCATNPSPTVSKVYVCAAAAMVMPCCSTPIVKPPRILTRVMTTAATASPRTNLLAPSMAP